MSNPKALEATPPAPKGPWPVHYANTTAPGRFAPLVPKVAEAMVETEMVRMTISETIRAMGVNPDEQLIGELTVFDAVAAKVRPALTAAQAVTEAMVEALKEARSVIYDTQQSCLYDDDDGQVGVTEDAVISPYHFQKICNSLKVIDDALTAAQEAGKP